MRFIPYNKLHKKKQKEIDNKQRGTWNTISPITRRAVRTDAYNRRTEKKRWQREEHETNASVLFAYTIN